MKLLVGLGNPGARYARNRHNVGFMAVEAIAREHGGSGWRKRFQGQTCEITVGGTRAVLLRPETFMNDSGRSVGEAMRYLKLTPADVIVFHDELDLDPGRIKMKTGGGNAGHNGLRSITAHIGNEYVRVRIGIGHPGVKELVHGWVLHDFAKSEGEWLQPLLEALAMPANQLVTGKYDRFASDVARRLEAVSGKPAKEPRDGAVATRSKRESEPKPVTPVSGGEAANANSDGAPSTVVATAQNALSERLARWFKRRPAGE